MRSFYTNIKRKTISYINKCQIKSRGFRVASSIPYVLYLSRYRLPGSSITEVFQITQNFCFYRVDEDATRMLKLAALTSAVLWKEEPS